MIALRHIVCNLLALLLPAGANAAAPVPIGSSFFGMHMNMGAVRAGYEWPSVPFGSWRLIHAATVWSGLEPTPGEWRWDMLDRAVDDAERRGVEALLTLGHTPDWAAKHKPGAPAPREGQAMRPPADLATWRTYVRTVAERYRGRVRWFELWNEPHFTETDRVDHGFGIDDMVALARVAREVLRDVDPQNRLVSFSPPGADQGIRRLELFFARGGGAYIDAIGFHFYTTPPSPEHVATLAKRLRAVAARHGLADKPIWNTEAGYMTEDAEHRIAAGPVGRHGDRYLDIAEAAAFVPRTLLMALHGGIERYYSYAWAIRGYSLSRDGGRAANAAGNAYATTHRWLLGALFRGCAQSGSRVWRCRLERAGDGAQAEVVWSSEGTATVATTYPWLETLEGHTQPLPAGQIEVGASPVLLKAAQPKWRGRP